MKSSFLRRRLLTVGTTSPLGAVVPHARGDLYLDTAHWALYIAGGTTSDTWAGIGGKTDISQANNNFCASVFLNQTEQDLYLVGALNGWAGLTDIQALQAGATQNAVRWDSTGGTDGTQVFTIQLGSGGR